MDYGFKITRQARSDLRNIWRYIARENAQTADRYCDQLLLAAESLQRLPHRHGGLVKQPHIRKVAFEAYLIFYKIDEESRTVHILRFWHGARDQQQLRLKEEQPAYAANV
jgi:plasmid stabilization system protein ParE